MKRMFFIVFFILISSLIFSQVIYLGAGYNLASSPFKKLNHVIDRYNDTRLALNLDPEMEKINFNQGMTYEFSFVQPYFQGGFGLQYNRARTHAKLVDANGIEQQRDLWLRMFSFPMELGVALGEDGLTTIPGIGINFMFWRYFTRAGEADNIDDIDYYQSTTDVCMHAKFYVKFI